MPVQPENDPLPRAVSVLDIVRAVRPVHPSKACAPTDFRAEDRDRGPVRPVQP